MKLPESFDFSQSKLQDYLDCPYRFYLRHIKKTRWPALVVDDAIAFEKRGQTGARFHRLIQQYLLDVPKERLSALAEADPEPQVALWWVDFLEHVPQDLTGEKFVEITLSTSLAQQRLIAKYDLILKNDETHTLTIFDWKTSQKKVKKAWLLERVQTRLYRFVLASASVNLNPEVPIASSDIKMVYWFAPNPQDAVTLTYSQGLYEKDKRFLNQLIRTILEMPEAGFIRTEDQKKCRFCVYRSHCNRGVSAGELSDLEGDQLDDQIEHLMQSFDEMEEISF